MEVLPGVVVAGLGPAVSVRGIVVEGEEVWVGGAVVGVREAGVWVGVFTPLQAATANRSKTIVFFI